MLRQLLPTYSALPSALLLAQWLQGTLHQQQSTLIERVSYSMDHAADISAATFCLMQAHLTGGVACDVANSLTHLCAFYTVSYVSIRPLTYRSCLAGCQNGINSGWEQACSSTLFGMMDADADSEAISCDAIPQTICKTEGCADYTNQYPRPAILNQCTSACVEGLRAGCKQAEAHIATMKMPAEPKSKGRPQL